MNLEQAIKNTARKLINTGQEVESKHWQGIKSPTNTWEALFIDIHAQMPNDKDELIQQVKPNLPWADVHFKERVGKIPLNPGESYKIWPSYGQDKEMRPGELFSHTYMERFWPKYAGNNIHDEDGLYDAVRNGRRTKGIRYEYGDLDGVINQLVVDPHTRQAFLPVWFPEDTGATDRRVPCTLGYHFMIRNGYLHLTYYIRSCDLLRHFQDDIYLAVMLADWVAHYYRMGRQQLTGKKARQLMLGQFNMHIGSLHIFKPEVNRVKIQFGL